MVTAIGSLVLAANIFGALIMLMIVTGGLLFGVLIGFSISRRKHY